MESGNNHTSHEEICSRLTVGGFVPKVDEILARLLGRSKVCHLTLVDDANLVEEIVERLSGLVDETIVDIRDTSVAIRSAWTNSRAVEALTVA